MKVELLHVQDCPHAAPFLDRIIHLVGDRGDVQIDSRAIADEHDAAVTGMTGSPTVLVDGTDPFADGSRQPNVSCRLYLDDDGRSVGLPSLAQLRAVFWRKP